jgi:hypothetical protein
VVDDLRVLGHAGFFFDPRSEENVVGYYTTGERMKYWVLQIRAQLAGALMVCIATRSESL